MQAIGATVRYYWGDETFHPEAEREYYTSHISFGTYDEDGEDDCDSFGVEDDSIFYYAKDEQELKDYLEYPTEEWILVDYELVYK